MKLPYKVGYILTIFWLILIVYGIISYDSDHEDIKATMVLFISFAGLILFPVYYVTIFLYYFVFKNSSKRT